jgi:hypothetical protein
MQILLGPWLFSDHPLDLSWASDAQNGGKAKKSVGIIIARGHRQWHNPSQSYGHFWFVGIQLKSSRMKVGEFVVKRIVAEDDGAKPQQPYELIEISLATTHLQNFEISFSP